MTIDSDYITILGSDLQYNAYGIEMFITYCRSIMGEEYFNQYPDITIFKTNNFYKLCKPVKCNKFKGHYGCILNKLHNNDIYVFHHTFHFMFIRFKTLLGYWLYTSYKDFYDSLP